VIDRFRCERIPVAVRITSCTGKLMRITSSAGERPREREARRGYGHFWGARDRGARLRDLSRAKDAAQYASRSTGTADGLVFARSDFFATMVLADACLAAGEPEQACRTTLAALTAGEQIRSGRCVSYLREFRAHLTRIGDTAAVRDFNEQARKGEPCQADDRPPIAQM
jgi:hypothetical protein